MSADQIERELKFSNVEHSTLRDRLVDLGAESQGPPVLEDHSIFDQQNQLTDSGNILRLRVDKRGAKLTFKGPAVYEGAVKVRREVVTGIDDVDGARAILEALGYELVQRYQKYREQWHLGSITISLDHTPIGDFAEFEGENCERVADRAGLDPASAERRNYLRLYEDYLREHPEAPRDMLFRE